MNPKIEKLKLCPGRRTHTTKEYLYSLDPNSLPIFPLFLYFSKENKYTNITIGATIGFKDKYTSPANISRI